MKSDQESGCFMEKGNSQGHVFETRPLMHYIIAWLNALLMFRHNSLHMCVLNAVHVIDPLNIG